MFVSDRLIYLQLEKTACTHIAYLLSQCIEGRQFFKHNSLRENVPNKIICGSIRNPWDWYVSLWSFNAKGDSKIYKLTTRRSFKNALKIFSGGDPEHFKLWLGDRKVILKSLRTISNAPKGIWSEWSKPIKLWQECYQDINNPKNFRQWLKLICDRSRTCDFDLAYAQNPISYHVGLMTYRYLRIFTIDFFRKVENYNLVNFNQLKEFDKNNNVLDEIIRVENLESDLLTVLEKADCQLGDRELNLIFNNSKTNKSNHLDTSFYYDRETIDLVAKKEKFIIEKYSYEPPKI